MSAGDVAFCTVNMPFLVIEEDVGAKGFEEFGFVHTAEEQSFINTNIPVAECSNNPFVRWGWTRGDERCTDRSVVLGVLFLKFMESLQEVFKGPPF